MHERHEQLIAELNAATAAKSKAFDVAVEHWRKTGGAGGVSDSAPWRAFEAAKKHEDEIHDRLVHEARAKA
jgi:hypothetical protein